MVKGWIDQYGTILARPKVNTAMPKAVINVVQENQIQVINGLGPQESLIILLYVHGNPQLELQEKRVIDSGCSRHMTENMSYLFEYEEINGGYVAFGGDPKGGKITGKGKISTDTECVVLSPDFKLLDESQVLLRVPRKNNMYNVDLKNIAPLGGLICLFAKATLDESNLWHRRLRHINFKTMNKLFCEKQCIKREFSVARTPQQNGVAEKNRTLIEAARTILADLKLPTTFWAEAVNTACYVQNRVLVIKPHNKTPYELFHGRTPSLSFMRPFGCPVTILNTLDPLGSRPNWIFDIDTLIKSMNYKPVVTENQSNGSAVPRILLVMDSNHQGRKKRRMTKIQGMKANEAPITEEPKVNQKKDNVNSTNRVNVVSLIVNAASNEVNAVEPKKVIQVLIDPSWIEAMQDKLLQFKLQQAWTLVDLPYGKRAIGTKWIYKNKKDEKDIMMDVKCTFLYGKIEEEISSMGELTFFLGLQETQKDDRIFISHDKYVNEILKKFGFSTMKTESTPMETSKPLMKDENAKDVDIHLYRSMIGSLMYLTSSRPDIMLVVCACVRFQVTPKVSHLHAVKRIFRYLKGQPKLGLWYPKDSPFDLEAYFDNDYASASLDRKSTT
nr:ribonuclease H-like domain, reverse transcriptase, RNA-dependent DNA polymerase [Tanacetum cinerariifolium]